MKINLLWKQCLLNYPRNALFGSPCETLFTVVGPWILRQCLVTGHQVARTHSWKRLCSVASALWCLGEKVWRTWPEERLFRRTFWELALAAQRVVCPSSILGMDDGQTTRWFELMVVSRSFRWKWSKHFREKILWNCNLRNSKQLDDREVLEVEEGKTHNNNNYGEVEILVVNPINKRETRRDY